ncbi:MAG: DUF2628 domain-containing protein [Methyloceanibacter sp.]
MTVYSVYEPTSDDEDIATRAGRVAFVKEGFAWFALIVPALWLLYHRMWIELIVFLAVLAGLQFAFGFDRLEQEPFSWAALALTILFAFEANDLRGAALQRRGYRFAGIASGSDQSDAERSFFTDWLPEQEKAARDAPPPKKATPAPKVPAPSSSRGADEDVIGLFPQA